MDRRTIALFSLLAAGGLAAGADERPPVPDVDIGVEGFQQLLPRGAMAAIFEPTFVSADEAEIPDEAWILGYATGEGEAYAYDLNLLNRHEVVNTASGGTPYAAVW